MISVETKNSTNIFHNKEQKNYYITLGVSNTQSIILYSIVYLPNWLGSKSVEHVYYATPSLVLKNEACENLGRVMSGTFRLFQEDWSRVTCVPK